MMDNNNSATDKIDMDASRDKQTKVPIEELEALADRLESPEGKTQLRDKTYCEYDETDTVTEIAEQCAQELRDLVSEYEG